MSSLSYLHDVNHVTRLQRIRANDKEGKDSYYMRYDDFLSHYYDYYTQKIQPAFVHIPSYSKVLYMHLRKYTTERDFVWIKIETLAAMTDKCPKTISNHLKVLEKNGFIKILRFKSGVRYKNVYAVNRLDKEATLRLLTDTRGGKDHKPVFKKAFYTIEQIIATLKAETGIEYFYLKKDDRQFQRISDGKNKGQFVSYKVDKPKKAVKSYKQNGSQSYSQILQFFKNVIFPLGKLCRESTALFTDRLRHFLPCINLHPINPEIINLDLPVAALPAEPMKTNTPDIQEEKIVSDDSPTPALSGPVEDQPELIFQATIWGTNYRLRSDGILVKGNLELTFDEFKRVFSDDPFLSLLKGLVA